MHRDLARHLTLLAVARVLVLVCAQQPALYRAAQPAVPDRSSLRGLHLHDRSLLRDITTRQSARPRGPPGLPGPVRPPLTCDVTAPEAQGAGRAERAGSRRPRGRGRRPQRRGARGRRGRGGGRRVADGRLRIGSLNIQSLKSKTQELAVELQRLDLDIMLLSETWLRPSTPSQLIVVPCYTISRVDRPDGRGYGGVVILARPLDVRPEDSRLWQSRQQVGVAVVAAGA